MSGESGQTERHYLQVHLNSALNILDTFSTSFSAVPSTASCALGMDMRPFNVKVAVRDDVSHQFKNRKIARVKYVVESAVQGLSTLTNSATNLVGGREEFWYLAPGFGEGRACCG